ncbi:MAG: hypothetical protein ACRD4X_01450 [Candidatus Acidiferrales bacterium]
MRYMWGAEIVAIALYLWIGEMIAVSWLSFPNAGTIFIMLGIVDCVSFFLRFRKRYAPALDLARRQPEDIRSVRRWMSSWITLICIAQSEALLGLAFRLGHKTLEQALPFYVLAGLLTLWLWPRPAWAPAV